MYAQRDIIQSAIERLARTAADAHPFIIGHEIIIIIIIIHTHSVKYRIIVYSEHRAIRVMVRI